MQESIPCRQQVSHKVSSAKSWWRRSRSNLSERMLQVRTHGGPDQAHKECVIRIEMGADSFVNCVAGGAASYDPLGIEYPSCPDQMQILEQVRVLLFRFA